MIRRRLLAALLLAHLFALLPAAPALADVKTGTFSIVAYDSVTLELGVAVQSKYFSVGTAVPWAEAGAGAVATQANVNVSLGPEALALLRTGMPAADVMRALAAADTAWEGRQVGIVDASGHAVGGDKRGMQSAALLVVRPSVDHPEYNVRYVDLRVEDHKTPIQELRRVWQIFEGFHAANAHLNYATQYEAQGRTDLAVMERERVGESMKRAIARGERDASLLNGLAWACATHDIFLSDAIRAAERAVEIEPRNIDILDTLAEVHYRAGNAAKAVEVESRAATLDPKSAYLKEQIERFRAGRK